MNTANDSKTKKVEERLKPEDRQSIQQWIREGRYDLAIQGMEKLLEQNPDDALLHNDLGVLYYGTGEKTKALVHYERAAQINPHNHMFLKNLADYYFVEQQRLNEARHIYETILTANSGDIDAALALGHVNALLEKFEDAMAYYHKVLEIDPQNALAEQAVNALKSRLASLSILKAPHVSNPPTHQSDIFSADPVWRSINQKTMPLSAWQEADRQISLLQIRVQERARQIAARERPLSVSLPDIDGRKMEKSILDSHAPWKNAPPPVYQIPGMITDEERQYYCYIARFYSNCGEVLELGPWLGCSTAYLMHGLTRNPLFQGRKLHIYDDFIWRSSWMDQYYKSGDRPRNHESFRHVFDHFTSLFKEQITVSACKIADYDGNQSLPPLTWTGGGIEFCFIDCGRNIEANEAWYRVLSPHFIPDKTLLVLQDWQTHKEVPFQWYNQMKQFTESKGTKLELIHELTNGGVATFLFKGN